MSQRRVYQLLGPDEAAASGSGAVVNMTPEQLTGTMQAEISVAGTVVLEGRMGPDAPWASVIASTTATGVAAIPFVYPQMRVTWTLNTGVINIWALV